MIEMDLFTVLNNALSPETDLRRQAESYLTAAIEAQVCQYNTHISLTID